MTQPVVNLGSCWSCVSDLTMPAIMVTGFRCVAEAIVRRWNTPRGGLVDDPNYGFDLSDYISDDLSVADLSRIASALSAEATKDERVKSCKVSLVLQPTGALQATGAVTTTAGPFQLVVSVSQVTVSLLSVSAT